MEPAPFEACFLLGGAAEAAREVGPSAALNSARGASDFERTSDLLFEL